MSEKSIIPKGTAPEEATKGLNLVHAKDSHKTNQYPVHWGGCDFSNLQHSREEFMEALESDPSTLAIWANEKRFVVAWLDPAEVKALEEARLEEEALLEAAVSEAEAAHAEAEATAQDDIDATEAEQTRYCYLCLGAGGRRNPHTQTFEDCEVCQGEGVL